jgi:tetratricopeptide (TPR) repeat protein
MRKTRLFRALFVSALLLAGSAAAGAAGAKGELGRVDFPTSARSPEAQADFLRGVLLLHSFEYPDAAQEFRKAQKAEPDFAMAYWGEAMTQNHPIWNQRDEKAASEILARLAPTPEERAARAPTEREKGFLRAVDTLFASGEKAARDRAYADEMGRLHEAFPKDDEVTCFYALALLGTCEGERDVPVYEKAGALAEEVFARRPDHPGAAHYVIHSYDDPAHAKKALEAARAYSKIAPAAPHALHMPSHIYLALGMWDDVIAANEASWKASGKKSYHALAWLQYGYLQAGRLADASRALGEMKAAVENDKSESARMHLVAMRAAQIIDTEGRDSDANTTKIDLTGLSPAVVATDIFASGFAHVCRGELVKAVRFSRALLVLARDTSKGPVPKILSDELNASMLAAKGARHSIAEKDLADAAAAADKLPYGFGPPDPVKPVHELWGDVFLRLGQPEEARRQFQLSLDQNPGRKLSLAGLRQAGEKLKAAAAK